MTPREQLSIALWSARPRESRMDAASRIEYAFAFAPAWSRRVMFAAVVLHFVSALA